MLPLFVAHEAKAQTPPEQAARDLVRRVLPGNAFRVEIIPADQGRDVFEIESSGDKLVLRGNNGVAVGFGAELVSEVLLPVPLLPEITADAPSEPAAAGAAEGSPGQPGPLEIFPELLLLRLLAAVVRLGTMGAFD